MSNRKIGYRHSFNNTFIALREAGFDYLADLAEEIKSQNPYQTNTIQHDLWNEFCYKNIPFLIVLSNYISDIYNVKNISKILFSTRDCVFLQPLFKKLFPQILSDTFYSSRALYLFPTPEYKEYCKKELSPDALLIDFQGTGQSFKTLVTNLGLEPWYLLVNWNSKDKVAYSNTYLHNYAKKIIIRSKNYYDDAIEKLNIDLIGTYFDYYDGKAISLEYEYNKDIMMSLHKCFECLLRSLDGYLEQIKHYNWTQSFNLWMDNHYTHGAVISNINWIHTHFKYDAGSITEIRSRYRNNKNVKNS